jgi:late competence protein required for DNA uptake (superfamily II DNA/RNA helicase)
MYEHHPDYKIRCDKCEKHVSRKKMSCSYGKNICHECLRKTRISKNYMLYVPSFIIKEAGIKPGDEINITNTTDQIIIKKTKKHINTDETTDS